MSISREFHKVGKWSYETIEYPKPGGSIRIFNILHGGIHWVKDVCADKGKCQCGKIIPGAISLQRKFFLVGWK